MKIKITIIAMVISIFTILGYFYFNKIDYYEKTELLVNDYQIYNYHCLSLGGSCGGKEILILNEHYYIIHQKEYISLNKAMELNLFTYSDINSILYQDVTQVTFKAKVLDIKNSSILIEPDINSNERKSSDKIVIHLRNIKEVTNVEIGTNVEITYDGMINESYPAQIKKCFKIMVLERNN